MLDILDQDLAQGTETDWIGKNQELLYVTYAPVNPSISCQPV